MKLRAICEQLNIPYYSVLRKWINLRIQQNLTEGEKLQLRIKELEHRNKYLEAENGLFDLIPTISQHEFTHYVSFISSEDLQFVRR